MRVGQQGENAYQLLRLDRLDWTLLRPTQNLWQVQSKSEQSPASAALPQRMPPQPNPLEKLRGQPSSPISKLGGLGAAWQGNFVRQPRDPALRTGLGSREDAAPLWLEPAGPPPSVAARQGMPAPGTAVAGERSPLLAVPGGLLGWAGGRRLGKDLLGKGSPFAFTCHRGPARRNPCPPALGSALSQLWRSTQRVELAPHVTR